MPAIPMPDPATEKVLDDARSQAAAGLKGRFPDTMLAPPPPAAPKISNTVHNEEPALPAPNALPPAPAPDEPPPSAVPVVDTSHPEPPSNAVPVNFGAEAAKQNTVGHAIAGSAGEMARELSTVAPRAALGIAKAVGFLASGVNNLAPADDTSRQTDDAIFNFIHNYVDKATEALTPTPDQTNPAAHIIGNVGVGAAPMVLGPAAIPAMVASATTDAGKASVDAGDNTKTAIAAALIGGVVTTGQVKLGFKDPSFIRQVAKWVGAGDALDEAGKATEILARHILQDESYQDALKKVDPGNLTNLTINSLMQTIFGILHMPKGQKLVEKADTPPNAPPPDAKPIVAGTGEPPPPPPPGPGPDAKPVVSAPLPEAPSQEPLTDLKAQVAAVKDPAQSRTHVYLPADTVTALGPDGVKALADGLPTTKNFDKNGGVLISQNFSERSKAAALRSKNGDDMQATLGALTGAGDGKSPDQTVVVQGQTPEGAVVKESMVKPEDVPAAVVAAGAEGHTPVVTTPEAAVQRRADMVQAETPAAPTEKAPIAAAPEGGTEVQPTAKAETPPVPEGPKAGERRIIKINGEEVPVVIAGDTAGNKTPVHLVDSDGRISRDVQNVPAELFKEEKPPTPAAAEVRVASASEAPAKGEAVASATAEPAAAPAPLEAAVKFFDQANTPPTGKKFAGSVSEHAGRVATLARVLKGAIKDFPDAAANVLEHAKAAANRVAGVDLKTEESMKHNRGVGHSMLDARAADIKQAIHNLLHPDDVTIPKPVETKADTLRKKVAEAAPAEPPPPAAGEKISTDALAALPRRNDATRDDKHWDDLKEAIRKNGITEPVTVTVDSKNENPRVYDGNHRVAIAKELGIKEIPTVLKYDSTMGELTAHPGKASDFVKEPPPAKPDWKSAAEKLKAEQAAARAAAPKTVAEKLKVKQAEKVKSGIADVEDVTKPKVLNAGDKARVGAALAKYMREDPDTVQRAHDNLERVLHEAYGPERIKEINDILTLAREQRADDRESHDQERRTGRLSDTVDEDEFQGKNLSKSDLRGQSHQFDSEEARTVPISPTSPLGRLHAALAGTGLFERLEAARDAGTFVGTHDVLDHMLKVARDSGNWVMEQALTRLRARAPDLPIRPVDQIIEPRTGELHPLSTVGLHDPSTRSIQVRVGPAATAPVSVTHSLAHEPGHAALSYEMQTNPNGKFAQTFKAIHAEAVRRAVAMGIDPESHYGLHTPGELAAELPINQELRDFLNKSESVAPKGPAPSLLARAWGAIREFFGAKDPRVNTAIGSLLQRADTALEQGRSAQAERFTGLAKRTAPDFVGEASPDRIERLKAQGRLPENDPTDHMPGLDDALLKIEALKDPPPLQHEDRFRKAAGDVATATARQFRTVMRSGLIESIRRTTRALTPYDALVRTQLRRGTFGHDEPGNPLRDLNESVQQRNAAINRMVGKAQPIVALRARLSTADNNKLGRFQDNIGSHGFAIEKTQAEQAKGVLSDKKFPQKWAEMQARWKALTPEQRDVYRQERDYNEWSARENRKASVNLALESFTDKEISPAKRALLYSAKDAGDFESLIGKGKMIDVGDRNPDLREALKDLSSGNELQGDYFHKGRNGDYVVQVRPDVDRDFNTQAEAEAHAAAIRELSTNSTAKVEEIGGKWKVTGKAEYVSMHEKVADAEKEAARLQAAGHDVGSATQKILSAQNTDLSKGFQTIYSEASRRLDKQLGAGEDSDKAIESVKASLRNAFVSQMAARSAYAGSKLARRNVGGVKAEEMGRSFATHALSQAWNTGHMATVLKTGDALSRLKTAVKDDTQTQGRALQRGRIYDEIQKRLRQEVQQYGSHQPLNSAMAKLGFLNYMTSPSHAVLYLTQNFTTAIPTAISRFGGWRAMNAFGASMKMIAGPAFRETYRALLPIGGHADVDSIQRAVLGAVAKDARFGKWAAGGENSPLQQLIDRGIIHTSMSNQLALAAHGGNRFTNSVMEYARITAAMADLFNRVSTGVAALELHKGDVYKAGDFVKETHIDYSQENKSRAFKAVGNLWGGNSVTMFRSYITGMTHLLYSHIYDSVAGTDNGTALGGRGEALKTVAGLMLGSMLFAGVQRSLGIEPVRLMAYAYHKLAGDSNEYYSFDNSVRRAIKSFAGDGKLAEVLNGGLPRLLGVDMSSRMGLSDLFFHDPPDVLSLNTDGITKMLGSLIGPMGELAASELSGFNKAAETGRLDDWMKLVPVKAVQNVYDAYKAGTIGKVTPSGAQITQSSGGAALSHAVGFRTGEEAELAAKARTESDYKAWASDRKYMFLKEYSSAPVADRPKIVAKMNAFSQANPGHLISRSDMLKAMRGVITTEHEAAGGKSRDPVVNELRSH